jgi:hypothetical protein
VTLNQPSPEDQHLKGVFSKIFIVFIGLSVIFRVLPGTKKSRSSAALEACERNYQRS